MRGPGGVSETSMDISDHATVCSIASSAAIATDLVWLG